MSFAFYDLETTGTNPSFDQPLQFAAILTDDNLVPIEEIDIRCRLAPHILPAPWALAVTGVTPDILMDPSLPSWFEFMQQISELIDHWGPTTWVGYNSISFDEQMLRHSFYQNLHSSPFQTQLNGNDRMDILKAVYAVWELAPDALSWPTDERDRHSFKLDQLAPANGFAHDNAHDALADVEATIFIARLIRERATSVWERLCDNRSKASVNAQLESGRPVRLVERFGAAPPKSYFGAFAGRNPTNPNAVGFMDLDLADPSALADATDQEIMSAVSATPKLIRTVQVNNAPSLFDTGEVEPSIPDRAKRLANMPDLHRRIGEALASRFSDREEPSHVEEQIYSGFYSRHDQHLLDRFQHCEWAERPDILEQLEDHRAIQLGRRLLFSYYPTALPPDTVMQMNSTIQERWMSKASGVPWMTFDTANIQLEEIAASGSMGVSDLETLRSFYDGKKVRETG